MARVTEQLHDIGRRHEARRGGRAPRLPGARGCVKRDPVRGDRVGLHGRDVVALDPPPGLVSHRAPPVRRAGEVLPGQAALVQQVAAYAADLVGLAVHEAEARGRRGKSRPRDRVGQQRRRRRPSPVRCSQRRSRSAGEVSGELVVGSVAHQADDGRAPAGSASSEAAIGGQGRLVADHQVPVGRGVGAVAAARAGEDERRRRARGGGPGAGDARVAVHHEVEGEQRGPRVPGRTV